MSSETTAEPMALLEAERRRQVEVEGWTPEHDDEHSDGELLHAAVLYLWAGTDKAAPTSPSGVPISWPWEPGWWKPKDRRSNLIRAGSLLLAEKERIQRASESPVVSHIQQKLDIVIRELTHG